MKSKRNLGIFLYLVLFFKSALSSDFGSVGLVDTPTARMSTDGSLLVTSAIQSRTNSYSLTYQVTPWLEGTFRYTGFNQADYSYDRNYELKARVIKESQYFPQIAIGIRDIVGTGIWGSEYLVASKKINNIDFTLGLGWGRLAGKGQINNPFIQLSEQFSIRDTDFGFGGKLSLGSFFSGEKAGLFGGINYSLPFAPVDFILEYNPDQYDWEVDIGGLDPESAFTTGIKYRGIPGFEITLSNQHGRELGISLVANIDTKTNPPKPPLRFFRSSLDYNLEEYPLSLNSQSWYDNLLFDVERSGILMLEASIDNSTQTATIVMGNVSFPIWIDAIELLVKLADLHLPITVTKFNIIVEEEGHRMHSLVLGRPSLNVSRSNQLSERKVIINPHYVPESVQFRTEFFQKKLFFDINLAQRLQLFDPDDPARYQVYAKIGFSMMLPNNWSLSGSLDQDLTNNFDESTRQSDSVLTRVRSEVVKYLNEGATGLDTFFVQKRGNLDKDAYYRLYGGILESMYSGVGGEMLYMPFRSRTAYGLSVNWVKKRDYKKTFAHLDFHTTTAFASAYWASPFYNLDFALHAGKYLAGDYGATLEVRRTFNNGWMVGLWGTKTNVSSRDFGEGSFDKGLFFKIPFNGLLGTRTRADYTTRIRPIQRDGGQYLEDFSGSIWWDIRAARYDALSESLNRMSL